MHTQERRKNGSVEQRTNRQVIERMHTQERRKNGSVEQRTNRQVIERMHTQERRKNGSVEQRTNGQVIERMHTQERRKNGSVEQRTNRQVIERMHTQERRKNGSVEQRTNRQVIERMHTQERRKNGSVEQRTNRQSNLQRSKLFTTELLLEAERRKIAVALVLQLCVRNIKELRRHAECQVVEMADLRRGSVKAAIIILSSDADVEEDQTLNENVTAAVTKKSVSSRG
ncbi:hypothetical protein EVAR_70197_1 [Eumeta japonica]|uniref:Uncharacterized protein n=1 Tax=Eumeta variegata TaxID=151549 RepID=A0A4C1ZRD5_EUMVA|nr:hypothetical protein EVAR_70197_1 [Eumeta japonica]